MKEAQFIARRRAGWEQWDRLLDRSVAAGRGRSATVPDGSADIAADDLPQRFRALCQDLSIARQRQYSSTLLDSLHHRVLLAQQRIYGARGRHPGAWLRFALHEFPVLVREQWRVVAAAALLLLVPLLTVLIALQNHPDAVYLLLSPESAGQLEEMYAPDARRLGRPRQASAHWMMWGFYISNNVRIDLQCFAGGIAFGLGSAFFLVYNGAFIGAAAGHLTQLGYIETFWGFVAGHSSFELMGAILSGAAGLKIGMAVIAPGRRARLQALKEEGRLAVRLLYGAAAMTLAAAFIEAFWSPIRTLPVEAKYGVGIALWIMLIAFLLLAGRRGRPSEA